MNFLAPLSIVALSLGTLMASPVLEAPLGQTPDEPAEKPLENLIDTVKSAGTFKTLLSAAEAAGILAPLTKKGPYTLLAPTDKAFEALGKDTVEDLLRPENLKMLKSILTYHVIAGSVSAQDALLVGETPTLGGPSVTFSLQGGQLRVNGDVNVTSNDIQATNGVIHVIDQVLIPIPEGRLVIGFFSERPGEELANYLGVNRDETLLVSSVTKGSQAETAGLKVFDLVVAVNGRAATSEVIGEEKEKAGYDGAITLEVLRKGVKMTIESKVGVEQEENE